MTDRQKATAVLKQMGFTPARPNPERFGNAGDTKGLPVLLTAFTPDEVLRILNDVEWGFRESNRNTEEITGALDAIALIRKYVQERAAGGSPREEHGCGCGRASCQC